MVAPFAAEYKSPDFWVNLINRMAAANTPIALLPVLLDYPTSALKFSDISFGMSRWGERDPESVARDPFPDIVHKLMNGKLAYMMPIAPQDVRPKSSIFWEAENTRLLRIGWEKAIRDQNTKYVQIITWNDYSESTEISPSAGTQFAYYDLSKYYITWFKTGQAPQIVKDAIYYSQRRQVVQIGHPPVLSDTPMKLLGNSALRNDIELIAFLTAPADLEIEIGEHSYKKHSARGLAEFRIPAAVGQPIFRIRRHGSVVLEKRSDWRIQANPVAEDPIYVGGSSNRPFTALNE